MAKTVDMSQYDEFGDYTLEEYVNKQGCTLGGNAEFLEKLKHCAEYCYIHGLITDSQMKQVNAKFVEKFRAALREL